MAVCYKKPRRQLLFREAIELTSKADVPAYRQYLAAFHRDFGYKWALVASDKVYHLQKALAIYKVLAEEYPYTGYELNYIETSYNLAVTLVKAGRQTEAEQLISELPPRTATEFVLRGLHYYRTLGQHQKARADFEQAINLGTTNGYIWYLVALLRLAEQDVQGYRKACEAMLEKFAESEAADDLHWVAWACVLTPDSVDDYSRPIELAERAVTANPDNIRYGLGLGAMLYRAGNFDEALEALNRSDKSKASSRTSPAYGWYFLAMTHHKLGDESQAKEWFDKAVTRAETELDETQDDRAPVAWNRRLTLELLRQEAEKLLGIPTVAPKPMPDQDRN